MEDFKKETCKSLNSSQSATTVYKSISSLLQAFLIFLTEISEFHPLSKCTARGFKPNGFATNKVTIDRNSQPIRGAASNLELVTDNQSIKLRYTNATKGWQYVYNQTT